MTMGWRESNNNNNSYYYCFSRWQKGKPSRLLSSVFSHNICYLALSR